MWTQLFIQQIQIFSFLPFFLAQLENFILVHISSLVNIYRWHGCWNHLLTLRVSHLSLSQPTLDTKVDSGMRAAQPIKNIRSYWASWKWDFPLSAMGATRRDSFSLWWCDMKMWSLKKLKPLSCQEKNTWVLVISVRLNHRTSQNVFWSFWFCELMNSLYCLSLFDLGFFLLLIYTNLCRVKVPCVRF